MKAMLVYWGSFAQNSTVRFQSQNFYLRFKAFTIFLASGQNVWILRSLDNPKLDLLLSIHDAVTRILPFGMTPTTEYNL